METYANIMMKATFFAAIIILLLTIIRAQEDETLRWIPIVLFCVLIAGWTVIIGIYTFKTVQEYPNAIRWITALIILAVNIYWMTKKLQTLRSDPPIPANNYEAETNNWPFHSLEIKHEHEPEIPAGKKKEILIKTILIGIFVAIPAVALIVSFRIFAVVLVSYLIIAIGAYFMDAMKKLGKLGI